MLKKCKSLYLLKGSVVTGALNERPKEEKKIRGFFPRIIYSFIS